MTMNKIDRICFWVNRENYYEKPFIKLQNLVRLKGYSNKIKQTF